MTATIGTIVTLMTRVLDSVFGGESWRTWLAVLKGAFGLPLTDEERERFASVTGGRTPGQAIRELWLICGRRSAKSIVSALLAVYMATCRTYTLAPGEVGVLMVIASDRRQARVVKRYIAGLLRAHRSLEALIAKETADSIQLTNGIVIEIHTCSYRSLRGYTCIGAVCDEVAFWQDEGSVNPDSEVLTALRAAMASVPEALLVCITTPYRRAGEVWKVYQKHFGAAASPVLVVQAPSRVMNPTLDEEVVNAALEDDAAAASAEYLAEFRKDIEALLSPELLQSVVIPGRVELPPSAGLQYSAFFDGAGGSSVGGDSATLAIGHNESGRVAIDFLREVKPPFSPEAVVAMFAEDCLRYRVRTVIGDRFAGEWPKQAFQKHGIDYRPAELTKSALYRELLPLISSGRVELPDHVVLHKQLLGLERRVSRSGQELIDHGPQRGAHDDVANAVAGVCHRLQSEVGQPAVAVIRNVDTSWQLKAFELKASATSDSAASRLIREQKSARLARDLARSHNQNG
jgi:hypothetical protein